MNLIETATHFALDTASVTIAATLLAIDGERVVRGMLDKSESRVLRGLYATALLAITTCGALAAKSWAAKGAALAIAGLLFAMGGEA